MSDCSFVRLHYTMIVDRICTILSQLKVAHKHGVYSSKEAKKSICRICRKPDKARIRSDEVSSSVWGGSSLATTEGDRL